VSHKKTAPTPAFSPSKRVQVLSKAVRELDPGLFRTAIVAQLEAAQTDDRDRLGTMIEGTVQELNENKDLRAREGAKLQNTVQDLGNGIAQNETNASGISSTNREIDQIRDNYEKAQEADREDVNNQVRRPDVAYTELNNPSFADRKISP
jgi:hypothetical protein